MKKVLLAVLFLAVLIGVSYYKSKRDSSKTQSAYQQGQIEGSQPVGQLKDQVDSLDECIARQQDKFADSLTTLEYSYVSDVDSLRTVIDSLQKARVKPKPKVSTGPARTTKDTAGPGGSEQLYSRIDPVKHREILSYYQQRFDSLPKDLSDYEKRIARDEIREETAQKFSISLDELDKIRKDHKLSY